MEIVMARNDDDDDDDDDDEVPREVPRRTHIIIVICVIAAPIKQRESQAASFVGCCLGRSHSLAAYGWRGPTCANMRGLSWLWHCPTCAYM